MSETNRKYPRKGTDVTTEQNPNHDLTQFQNNLLYVLLEQGEVYGLGIKARLEDFYEGEIHHGRLYPNLDTLINKGLVTKREADQRTNLYRLTRRGFAEVTADADWRAAVRENAPDQFEAFRTDRHDT